MKDTFPWPPPFSERTVGAKCVTQRVRGDLIPDFVLYQQLVRGEKAKDSCLIEFLNSLLIRLVSVINSFHNVILYIEKFNLGDIMDEAMGLI